jgi:hypothetical protein
MPTFSYKGYDFEVDHTPTEQEFAQMSQYVDTLPAKGGLVPQVQGSPEVQGTPMSGALETITSMVSGLPQAVHQMGTRAALAASNITDPAQKEQILQEATPQLLKDITYEPKTETGKRYAETAGEVWNTIARSPFAALEAVVQGRGQTGARDIVSEKTPSRFTDVGALAVDVGGLMSPFATKRAKPTKSLDQRVKEAEGTREHPVNPPDETGYTPPQSLDESTPIYGPITREDIVGRPEPEMPLPTMPDEVLPLSERPAPQGLPIGQIEAGGPVPDMRPLPSLENVGRMGLLDFADDVPTKTPDTQRLATRHDFPTVDFPLRQEVLQTPEIRQAIDAFRSQADELRLTSQNAINKDVRNRAAIKLADLEKEFAAGMRQLGIDTPQQAVGLQNLYEGGKPTKLPIEHGFVPKGQRGSIDIGVFKEGIDKLADKIATKFGLKLDVTEGPISGLRRPDAEEILSFVHGGKPVELTAVVRDHAGKNLGHVELVKHDKGGYEVRDILIDDSVKSKGLVAGLGPTLLKGLKDSGVDLKKSDYTTEAGKKLTDKLGQSRFGKSQRGSVNLFSTTKKVPTFEQYHKAIEDQLGRKVDEAIARKLYNEDHPTKTPEAKTSKVIKEIPGLEKAKTKYESADPEDITGTTERMAESAGMDLEKEASATFRNMTSAGRLQSWILDNPIVNEGVKFITSVKDKYRIQAANQMSDLTKHTNFFESGIIGKSWKDAFDVFVKRRENEFNPEFVPEKEFSGKQLELFNYIDETMDNIYEQVNQRRKELNPEATDLPKLPFYLTSYFRGDWQIPVFSENNKFLFSLRENSKANAQAAAKWAQEQGFNVREPSLKKTGKWADRRMDARADFEEMMDILSNKDPDVQSALNRMVQTADKVAMATRDMPSRFKEKSGKVGSLGDRPWRTDKENYYDFKKALEMYIEGANEWLGNTQVSKFTKEMNNTELKAPNATSFVNDYADYVTGNKEALIKTSDSIQRGFVDILSKVPFAGKHIADSSKLKTVARQFANFQTALFVGWYSGRMFLQNAIQPYTATLPKLVELGSLENAKGSIPEALAIGTLEGVRDFGQLVFGDLLGKSDSTSFKQDNHVVSSHLVENAKMFDNFHANKVYDTGANLSIRASEQFARSLSFSIYQKYLESAGYNSKTAMDMAKNLTHETMGNYESYAKAQAFGRAGLAGELSGRLQTFKVNAATQTLNYIAKAKQDPLHNWQPLATNLFMGFVTAGMMGIIGMDVAELMWDMIQTADRSVGKPTEWVQENTPKKFIFDNAPGWASMGALSTFLGANLGGAFTQNLVGDNPLASLFPVLGGLGEVAQAPANIMSSSDVNKARGLNAILPSSAKQFTERQFLTDVDQEGTHRVVSPFTGSPVYKGKDQGYISRGTNIQTLERGKQSMSNRFHKEYSKDVNEVKAQIMQSVDKLAWDIYKNRNNLEFGKKKVAELTEKYYNAGGDPAQVQKALGDQLKSIGIADPIVEELMQTPTLSNRKTYGDALKQFK